MSEKNRKDPHLRKLDKDKLTRKCDKDAVDQAEQKN